jgi:catechol 2,3-dioxygenase-like lactoylglutathione lyase family enzyme
MRTTWTKVRAGMTGFLLLAHPCLATSAQPTPVESASNSPISDIRKGDMKLEIVVLSVTNVDRAKKFYANLGWRQDADISKGDDFRVVQLTPPGSQCAIIFGKGITAAKPGSTQDLTLAVSDVAAARTDLMNHGVAVSEVFHDEGGVFHHAGKKGRVSGPDPQGRSYSSWVSFSDPDGNGWMVQEIKKRLPGRVDQLTSEQINADVSSMTDLLKETEQHHGKYEASAPKHNWADWYAAYIVARQNGKSPDDAVKEAGLHMENLHH